MKNEKEEIVKEKEMAKTSVVEFKRVDSKLTFIGGLIIGILILVGLYFAIFNKRGQTTISSKSELLKVLDVSELSAAEYTYNGIATKTTKDNKVAYYVSYEGTVKAGIDFKDIN